MAHKPLIGGTAYEITGGNTLIEGTAYSIKSGKTLIGGTVYEVGFVPMLNVTMTQANPSGVTAHISWDDGIASTPGTYQVPAGTSMKAFIKHAKNLTEMSNYIFFNGKQATMASYSDNVYTWSEYDFTLTKDITFYVGTYGKGAYAIYINEV